MLGRTGRTHAYGRFRKIVFQPYRHQVSGDRKCGFLAAAASICLAALINAVAFSAFDETPHRIRQQVTAGYCTCKACLPETVYTTPPRAQEAQQCLRTCMSCETFRCKREFGHTGIHNCGSYRCRLIYVQEDDEENF